MTCLSAFIAGVVLTVAGICIWILRAERRR